MSLNYKLQAATVVISLAERDLTITEQTSNGTNHFGLVQFGYSGPALKVVHSDWPGHFGWSYRINVLFHLTKQVVSSTALLYPANENNNQTRGDLVSGLCSQNVPFYWGHEISQISNWIFVEWKAHQVFSKRALIIKHTLALM